MSNPATPTHRLLSIATRTDVDACMFTPSYRYKLPHSVAPGTQARRHADLPPNQRLDSREVGLLALLLFHTLLMSRLSLPTKNRRQYWPPQRLTLSFETATTHDRLAELPLPGRKKKKEKTRGEGRVFECINFCILSSFLLSFFPSSMCLAAGQQLKYMLERKTRWK